MDSAEMKKVRESMARERESARESTPTPPPSSRAARVPREDEDESGGPVSIPRSDHFVAATPRTPAQPFSPQKPLNGNMQRPMTAPQSFKPQQTQPQPFKPTTSAQAFRPMTAPQAFKPVGSPAAQKAAKTTGSWGDEAPTGQRTRKPVTIDAVGDTAARMARTTRQTAPKVIATPQTIASAPLDSRSAFILSLVDGISAVPAIVDASGLAEDEVIGILARLARLGLISVP